MQKLVDKYGLYTSHLRIVVADTTKQRDCILLQGKFEILVKAKKSIAEAFFLNTLGEAKKEFFNAKKGY